VHAMSLFWKGGMFLLSFYGLALPPRLFLQNLEQGTRTGVVVRGPSIWFSQMVPNRSGFLLSSGSGKGRLTSSAFL